MDLKELYKIADYKDEKGMLFNGDCLEIMKDIPDKSIDMILCDLPYGTTACKGDIIIPFEPLWEQYNRIIKNNGAIALFGSEPFSSYLRMSNIKNYKYDWIWIKNIKTNFVHAKRQPLRQYENICIFYKNQCDYTPQKTKDNIPTRKATNCSNGNLYYESKRDYEGGDTERYPTNILYYDVVDIKHRFHPTQKPLDLVKYIIKTYTLENDIILDNCMGSGTTCVGAKELNRRYIGIEKEKEYFDISVDRTKECNINVQ